MKRFVIKTLIFAIFCALVSTLMPLAVDPYNVFHTANIRDNGVEPNKHYIKMEYLLGNEVDFDAYLFGSSRVGALHTEKLEGVKCYNMTYSEGLPVEHLENVRSLIAAGKKLKKVYIGVDVASYTNPHESHHADPIRMPYEYIKAHRLDFYRTYFDPAKAFRALPTIFKHKADPGYADIFYNKGWAIDYDVPDMAADAYVENTIEDGSDWASEMETELEAIRELKQLCDENAVELIVFTLPMHEVTYKNALKHGYKDFLAGLESITAFYDFSGLNPITEATENYIDPSHFNAEVGDVMIDVLNGNEPEERLSKKGFGRLCTGDGL
ncbi:MAG: hypothetical protein K5686_09210 [Lachnospiraceae bacterium]|nr:hypothetical protein [Lachnospiraceae bacterium]